MQEMRSKCIALFPMKNPQNQIMFYLCNNEQVCGRLCKTHIKELMNFGWPGAMYIEPTKEKEEGEILEEGEIVEDIICHEPFALELGVWKHIIIVPYAHAIKYDTMFSKDLQDFFSKEWKEIDKTEEIYNMMPDKSDKKDINYLLAFPTENNLSKHKQKIITLDTKTLLFLQNVCPNMIIQSTTINRYHAMPHISIKYLLMLVNYYKGGLWYDISLDEWKQFSKIINRCSQDKKLQELADFYIRKFENIITIVTENGVKFYFNDEDNVIAGSEFLFKQVINNSANIINIPVYAVIFNAIVEIIESKGRVADLIKKFTPKEIVLLLQDWNFLEITNKLLNKKLLSEILSYLGSRVENKFILTQIWVTTVDITEDDTTNKFVNQIELMRALVEAPRVTEYEKYFPKYIRNSKNIPQYKPSLFKGCEKIGKGAFGSVVSCFDSLTRNRVAIKQIIKESETTDMVHIMREINILIHLCGHPNIIQLQNVYQDNEKMYLVTPFHTNTLHNVIYKSAVSRNFLPLSIIKQYINQLLLGLRWSHIRGVIHADVKPQNIMVDDATNQIKIIDFGSSKLFTNEKPYRFRRDADIVTVTYRAPELFFNTYYNKRLADGKGGKYMKLPEKIDVWSAGIILIQMLTPKYIYLQGNEEDNSPFAITQRRIHNYYIRNVDAKEKQRKDEETAEDKRIMYNDIVLHAIYSTFVDKNEETGDVFSKNRLVEFLKDHSHTNIYSDKDAINFILSLVNCDPAIRSSAETALKDTFIQASFPQISFAEFSCDTSSRFRPPMLIPPPVPPVPASIKPKKEHNRDRKRNRSRSPRSPRSRRSPRSPRSPRRTDKKGGDAKKEKKKGTKRAKRIKKKN